MEQWPGVLALTVVGVVGIVAIVSIVAPSTMVQESVVLYTNSTGSSGQTDGGLLGPSTLFTAAATILGFAAFGAPITMAIERKPKRKDLSWRAKIRAFIFLMALVVLQVYTLLALLFGASWDFAVVWAWSTGVLLILFVAFMILGNSYSKEESSDQPPQQEDPSTTLQRRCINGEVTRKEFLMMKKDLDPRGASNNSYLFWGGVGLGIAAALVLASTLSYDWIPITP